MPNCDGRYKVRGKN